MDRTNEGMPEGMRRAVEAFDATLATAWGTLARLASATSTMERGTAERSRAFALAVETDTRRAVRADRLARLRAKAARLRSADRR